MLGWDRTCGRTGGHTGWPVLPHNDHTLNPFLPAEWRKLTASHWSGLGCTTGAVRVSGSHNVLSSLSHLSWCFSSVFLSHNTARPESKCEAVQAEHLTDWVSFPSSRLFLCQNTASVDAPNKRYLFGGNVFHINNQNLTVKASSMWRHTYGGDECSL